MREWIFIQPQRKRAAPDIGVGLRQIENEMTLSIGQQEVHVWYVRVRDCLARYSEEDLLAILPEDERAQCLRSPLEKVRQERLVSRALIRFGHSWYVDVPPQSWRFRVNDFGRPELEPQSDMPRLRFNASHSHGLVACGFALNRDIGVDVEDVTRSISPIADIASRYLSPAEHTHLAEVPESHRRRTFFGYWTLKEAYAKAHGIGIAIGFRSFAIDITQDPPALVSGAEPGHWQFARCEVAPSHLAAVAVHREPSESLDVTFRPVTELR